MIGMALRAGGIIQAYPAWCLEHEIALPYGETDLPKRPFVAGDRMYVQPFGSVIHEIEGWRSPGKPRASDRRLGIGRAHNLFVFRERPIGLNLMTGMCAALDEPEAQAFPLPV